MSTRLVYLACLACACGSTAKPPAPAAPPPAAPAAPAVATGADPAQPTLRLPRHVLPTAYRARLAVDPAIDTFTGAIEIDAQVSERTKGFWLHGRALKITSAKLTAGSRTQPLTVTPAGDELLSLRAAEPFEAGKVTIALEYTGAFSAKDPIGPYKKAFDGAPYVETQFESTFARRAFPCFDEPDNKVPWQLTLDVPKDLVAVANTPATGETALDGKTKRVVFAQTRPLPSYLLAFGVGPFEMVDAGKTRAGTQLRIIALKGRAHEAKWAADTSLKVISLLEDYFGMPYPYPKLDQLASPNVVGGAMENPGLVIYAKALILNEPDKASPTSRYQWISVAAHELAHQWFGDLVTTAWWDDIWLNEGFASWLGDKVTAQFDPGYGGELLAAASRKTAVAADSEVTARRIRQPIRNMGDISQAFDQITYSKGASVLAMFEHTIGPDKFRDGVRAYLAKHKDGNATSANFIAAISEIAGHDVAPAFHSFLEQAGVPLVRAELRCAAGKPPVVALSQQRYVLPGSPVSEQTKPWRFPLCVAFDAGGKRGEACTEMSEPTAELALETKACPKWIFPNAGGHGYYLSAQPDAAVIALRDRGWKQLLPIERVVAFDDLAAFAATGETDIALPLSLIGRMVADRRWAGISSASRLTLQLRDWIDDAQRSKLDAWVRTTYGPTARAYGWTARANDSYDSDRGRQAVVTLVAGAGDAQLRAAAVVLAKDIKALQPGARVSIMTAAADADRPTFDRLLAALPTEQDRQLRLDMVRALSQVSDPAKLAKLYPLVLDDRLDQSESLFILFGASERPAQRAASAFMREHLDAVLKRIPDMGLGIQVRVGGMFLRNCDPATREADVAYVREKFGHMVGAERVIVNATEGLDHCIAARKLLAPKIAAWLARGGR